MSNTLQEMIDVVFNRADILEMICNETHDKRKLVNNLPISRPTIDRAVRELEDHNLVKRSGGICKPTFSGKLALEMYKITAETIKTIHNNSEMLNELPENTNLPLLLLMDGSIHLPSDCAPYSPIEPVYPKLKKAETLESLIPVILPHQLKLVHQKFNSTNADAEVIINSNMLDTLLKQHYEKTHEMISKGNTLYRVDQIPNYSLFICDDKIVFVTIYSPTNQPLGVIENSSERALQWAQNQYLIYRKNASLLTC